MSTTALDKTRRYLVPVARLKLAGHPHDTHLSVYEWMPAFEAWVTGLALCGYSTEQGVLPEGTEVTCAGCMGYQPRYERMLTPGYRPEEDDREALRKRAETAEELLRCFVALGDVTHKYPIAGGHDNLGADLTCSGCALRDQARAHLEAGR